MRDGAETLRERLCGGDSRDRTAAAARYDGPMATRSEQLPLFDPATGIADGPALAASAPAPARSRQSRPGASSGARPRSPARPRPSERRWRERAFEVVAETLWPTRCAVCDRPGTPLCPDCIASLPYIDSLLACPRCGAPFGRVQCTECNRVLLAAFGYEEPPYRQATSPLVLTEKVRRIVTVYKDQGERSLARPMASLMARAAPPPWLDDDAVAFVPATAAARRRRGFDHAEHLARELSWLLDVDFTPLLATPRRLDQRRLGRAERIQNMREALRVLPGATVPDAVILVDDVCTTGSTLFAATEALKAQGARTIHALTFARA